MLDISQAVWVVALSLLGALLAVIDLFRKKGQTLLGWGLLSVALAILMLAK